MSVQHADGECMSSYCCPHLLLIMQAVDSHAIWKEIKHVSEQLEEFGRRQHRHEEQFSSMSMAMHRVSQLLTARSHQHLRRCVRNHQQSL